MGAAADRETVGCAEWPLARLTIPKCPPTPLHLPFQSPPMQQACGTNLYYLQPSRIPKPTGAGTSHTPKHPVAGSTAAPAASLSAAEAPRPPAAVRHRHRHPSVFSSVLHTPARVLARIPKEGSEGPKSEKSHEKTVTTNTQDTPEGTEPSSVHGSTTHSCQKVETTQASTHSKMHKQNVEKPSGLGQHHSAIKRSYDTENLKTSDSVKAARHTLCGSVNMNFQNRQIHRDRRMGNDC